MKLSFSQKSNRKTRKGGGMQEKEKTREMASCVCKLAGKMLSLFGGTTRSIGKDRTRVRFGTGVFALLFFHGNRAQVPLTKKTPPTTNSTSRKKMFFFFSAILYTTFKLTQMQKKMQEKQEKSPLR